MKIRKKAYSPCVNLRKLYSIDSIDNRASLDYLFREVDKEFYKAYYNKGFLQTAFFEKIDYTLKKVDLKRISNTLIVGFLSITAPHSEDLKERNNFIKKARVLLLKRCGLKKTDRILRSFF